MQSFKKCLITMYRQNCRNFLALCTPRKRYGLFAASLLLFAPCGYAEQAQDPSTTESAMTESPVTQGKHNAPRVFREPAKLSILKLAEALPEEQVLWLQGPKFDPDAVMALYLPASLPAGKGSPQGGMLLLHDQGQHPDWPQIIGELRRAMPDKGWHTLSLALLGAPRKSLPQRTMLARTADNFPYVDARSRNPVPRIAPENADVENNTIPEEGANAEAAVDELSSEIDIDAGRDADLLAAGEVNAGSGDITTENTSVVNNIQRIDLGLQRLQSMDVQVHSVIGVGNGAEQLLSYLLATPQAAGKMQAMVWINAQFTQALLTRVQQEVPGWSAIQVLDIYDSTQPTQKKAAKRRREFARRFHPGRYQSASLPGLTMLPVNASQRLVNRIWSWQKSVLDTTYH